MSSIGDYLYIYGGEAQGTFYSKLAWNTNVYDF
jgi:hypothetical protein